MVDQTLAFCLRTLNRKFPIAYFIFKVRLQALWVENVGASNQWEEIFVSNHHLKANTTLNWRFQTSLGTLSLPEDFRRTSIIMLNLLLLRILPRALNPINVFSLFSESLSNQTLRSLIDIIAYVSSSQIQFDVLLYLLPIAVVSR